MTFEHQVSDEDGIAWQTHRAYCVDENNDWLRANGEITGGTGRCALPGSRAQHRNSYLDADLQSCFRFGGDKQAGAGVKMASGGAGYGGERGGVCSVLRRERRATTVPLLTVVKCSYSRRSAGTTCIFISHNLLYAFSRWRLQA